VGCFFFFNINILINLCLVTTTPTITPLPPTLLLPTTVEDFLKQLNREGYLNVFVENGFDTIDTLKYLDTNALNDMKVLRGHQGNLLARIREIN
jgi:hypothetical protein